MPIIYHITTAAEWASAKATGIYTAPSLQTEGFIHCSNDDRQTAGVLQRYFTGKIDLVKLVIDTDKLKHELRYELALSVNEEFPHIYGPVNPEAVISVEPVT